MRGFFITEIHLRDHSMSTAIARKFFRHVMMKDTSMSILGLNLREIEGKLHTNSTGNCDS